MQKATVFPHLLFSCCRKDCKRFQKAGEGCFLQQWHLLTEGHKSINFPSTSPYWSSRGGQRHSPPSSWQNDTRRTSGRLLETWNHSLRQQDKPHEKHKAQIGRGSPSQCPIISPAAKPNSWTMPWQAVLPFPQPHEKKKWVNLTHSR